VHSGQPNNLLLHRRVLLIHKISLAVATWALILSIKHNSLSEQRNPAVGIVKLVCLPFAGGSSAPFYRWRSRLPDWIELAPVSLPGHDGRLHEPPFTDLRKLVAVLVDDIQTALDQPFVLLGHSMGAWLAFEMARELRRRGALLPELLVVSASRAPHLRSDGPPIYQLPESELLEALTQSYGGIPTEVSSSRELLQLLLPALRADLQMIETHRYAEELPLDVEILALGGIDDAAVSPAQLEGWRRHATRACSVRLLPGGHFFLFDQGRDNSRSGTSKQKSESSAALRIIVDRIEKCRPTAPADGTAPTS
jgi:medium-chain acyl-[acyl-carrier-protein] hydrolase